MTLINLKPLRWYHRAWAQIKVWAGFKGAVRMGTIRLGSKSSAPWARKKH